MCTGDLSTGAADDLKRATDMARRMVTQYGMSELGPLTYGAEEDTVFLGREITRSHDHSDDTANRIDAAIQEICKVCYEKAQHLLEENRDNLERLATALIEWETLSADEVDLVLKDGDVAAHRKSLEVPSGPTPATAEEGEAEKSKDDEELPGLDRGAAPGFA
jgi:cell division protease FtsH